MALSISRLTGRAGTWFASAHDSDDVPYRMLVFVQIAAALVFATGVGDPPG